MKPTKLSILNFQFSISFALAVAVLLGACGDKEAQETQSLLQCNQFRKICEIAFGSFGRRTRFA